MKLKNNITCAIQSSLKIKLQKTPKLNSYSIEQNKENVPNTNYSILILNKQTHGLYSSERFRSENDFDVVGYYDESINSLQDIADAIETLDFILTHPGVLSYQQVMALMKLGILIFDGDSRRVQGASYDLLIDSKHLRSGVKVETLDVFEIKPYDYVIVGAKESANIPKNICASFDIKVSLFCRGVILSNGPQVDPGYQGRLLCLLFNTSAKEIEIGATAGFPFSTIQFYALSVSTKHPYAGRYQKQKDLSVYLSSRADESMAERVNSIPGILESIEDLKSNSSKRFTGCQLLLGIVLALLASAFGAVYFVGNYIGTNDGRLKTLEAAVFPASNTATKTASTKPQPPPAGDLKKATTPP